MEVMTAGTINEDIREIREKFCAAVIEKFEELYDEFCEELAKEILPILEEGLARCSGEFEEWTLMECLREDLSQTYEELMSKKAKEVM